MRLSFTQDAERVIVDDTVLDLRSQLTKMAYNQQLSIDDSTNSVSNLFSRQKMRHSVYHPGDLSFGPNCLALVAGIYLTLQKIILGKGQLENESIRELIEN